MAQNHYKILEISKLVISTDSARQLRCEIIILRFHRRSDDKH